MNIPKLIIASVCLLLSFGVFAQEKEFQVITPDPVSQDASANQAAFINVIYTTDPQDETLTGLGLRIHWDSSQLDSVNLTEVFQTGLLGVQFQLDTSDFDDDPDTDMLVLAAWIDIFGKWPGDGQEPVTLYTTNFTTNAENFSGSIINFSSPSTAAGRDFFSTSAVINAEETPPLEQIANILEFFDQSVADGTLVGEGPGNSAKGRLNALRNMIKAAGNLIIDEDIEETCQQLQDAFNRTDGQFPPPDFAAGSAASDLAKLIQNLRSDLECDLDDLSDKLLVKDSSESTLLQLQLAILDVDGNGVVNPLTDGALIVRCLSGSGENATAPDTTYTCQEIQPYLERFSSELDMDGNGVVDSQTDGILVARYLFGFKDNILCENAIAPNATRTCQEIQSYLESLSE